MADKGNPEKTGGDATAVMEWYVIKVQSNRERSVRDSLLRRIKMDGLENEFGEILIPTDKVVETKGGKKKIREEKRFPGYMMIEMHLTDESWHLVRGTSGVGDFTGASGKPIAMTAEEVARMRGETTIEGDQKSSQPVIKFNISAGDIVKVKEGPFESFEGTIDSIEETSGKVKVIVEIFGRPTEVELQHYQVEKT